MTEKSYDTDNKHIAQLSQNVEEVQMQKVHNAPLDSSVQYQLEPLVNQSRDHLFKNVSTASSPTESSHNESVSRGINISGSHDQNEKNWPTPPTYSRSDGKHTDDGHLMEAGLSGVNATEIDEVKEGLQTDKQIRMAFVRKVYFLLSLQLLCTVLISVLFTVNKTVSDYVQNHPALFFISWILALIALVVLFWQRKRYPLNIVLLFTFTLIASYSIGTVVSMYSAKIVIQSLLITLGVFVALQVFTLQSKFDFSSWGPFLYAFLWALIVTMMIGFILPFDRSFHILISAGAALLFSAYIIYDTYMIFKRMNPEEYIVAVVELYLDILNIFAVITTIIGGTCEASS
ncbi:4669_t:CDS:2 [Acaulospora morrowiae]|uniref:4669_t:CDS:1 n=1 Tax=Acaulospora morrowiae TaxID=94023 RepID=A0A9N9E208_9GLOM|nr:4669_t:CDS:2 [Acaulospora morrowiae]